MASKVDVQKYELLDYYIEKVNNKLISENFRIIY